MCPPGQPPRLPRVNPRVQSTNPRRRTHHKPSCAGRSKKTVAVAGQWNPRIRRAHSSASLFHRPQRYKESFFLSPSRAFLVSKACFGSSHPTSNTPEILNRTQESDQSFRGIPLFRPISSTIRWTPGSSGQSFLWLLNRIWRRV